MSIPSKTFKVYPMYRMLYHSCIDVVSENKSPLTKALLQKEIGKDKVLSLQLYEFNELIELMIYDLKKAVHASSYDEVAFKIRSHNRYMQILESYKTKGISDNLVMLSFRVPEVIVEEVHKLKRIKLGEVVELAIALYVTTCDEEIFKFVLLSFQHM